MGNEDLLIDLILQLPTFDFECQTNYLTALEEQ